MIGLSLNRSNPATAIYLWITNGAIRTGILQIKLNITNH